MSDDIVDRLEDLLPALLPHHVKIVADAMAEIERLRAKFREILALPPDGEPFDIARDALRAELVSLKEGK